MSNEIDKIRQEINELELLLKDYKTAIRVIESFEEKEVIKSATTVVNKRNKKIKKKPSYIDLVLKDVRERLTDIKTNDLVIKHSERTGLSLKKARNAVYQILIKLKERELIESYKTDPKVNGSYYRIKNPDMNQG